MIGNVLSELYTDLSVEKVINSGMPPAKWRRLNRRYARRVERFTPFLTPYFLAITLNPQNFVTYRESRHDLHARFQATYHARTPLVFWHAKGKSGKTEYVKPYTRVMHHRDFTLFSQRRRRSMRRTELVHGYRRRAWLPKRDVLYYGPKVQRGIQDSLRDFYVKAMVEAIRHPESSDIGLHWWDLVTGELRFKTRRWR